MRNVEWWNGGKLEIPALSPLTSLICKLFHSVDTAEVKQPRFPKKGISSFTTEEDKFCIWNV